MPARSTDNQPAPGAHPRIGDEIGNRYQLIAPIGSGASATVYLAEDTSLRRRVAVKLLHPGLVDNPSVRRRFRAEAQAAARLSHVHIMAVFDWGDGQSAAQQAMSGEAFLVTEYLGGGSLRSILDAGERLTLSQGLLVCLHAAQGLDHAHRHGLVHRDVKPANLMFGLDQRLRIGDFGIARTLSEAGWTEPEGALIGTARYAAPEQATGGTIDGRADVYSLALTVIELITGSVPMVGTSPIATMVSRHDTDIEVPAELGPLREPFINATRADPAERTTAEELVKALLAIAPTMPKPTPLPLRPDPVASDGDSTSDVLVLGADGASVIELDASQAHTEPLLDKTEIVESIEDDYFEDLDPNDADALAGVGSGPFDGDDEFRRPRRRWPWLVALLGLLAVAGIGYAGVQVQREMTAIPTHIVGSYVGDQIDSVEDEFTLNRWTATLVYERLDGTVPGEILQQTPEAGTVLPEGVGLTLVVSEGPELREVPMLVGRTKDEAIAALAEANLSVGSINTAVFDEVVPAGSVIETSQPAGTELETGTEVDLVISAGPNARVVPAVAGMTYDNAAAAMAALVLIPVAGEAHSETVPEGAVIGTNPEAGVSVARDTEIQIVVSLGLPFITVPDVSGKSASEAADILEAAGFVVEDTVGKPNAKVITTSPEPGQSRRKGSGIVILTKS